MMESNFKSKRSWRRTPNGGITNKPEGVPLHLYGQPEGAKPKVAEVKPRPKGVLGDYWFVCSMAGCALWASFGVEVFAWSMFGFALAEVGLQRWRDRRN